MSELANRKAMLRQKIESDRQLIELEVEGMRQRWDSATRMLKMGVDLAKPVGAVAALAATSVGRAGKVAGKAAGKAAGRAAGSKAAKAGAGGLVGLAALIPVAITVAKAVASMREDRARKKDDTSAAGEPDADAAASKTSAEPTGDATAP